MSEVIVLTMVPDRETALKIARNLVECKLAACVNIVDKVTSVYEWKGEICEEGELLLIIKSVAANFTWIKDRILELHPYELPEVIMFNIDAGLEEYLAWIRK